MTLILVSQAAWAAPGELRPEMDSLEDFSNSNEAPNFLEENLVLSQPKMILNNKTYNSYYYRYKQGVSVRTGLYSAIENRRLLALVGANFLVYRAFLPQWEVGVELMSKSIGFLMFSLRWTYFRRKSFRPFYKLGMAHKLVPSQEIASITNKHNYFLYAVGGFERSWTENLSLRADLEFGAGLQERWVKIIFGGSMGW